MSAPSNDLPRYSTRPFPAYRFVPGRAPHPTRDPAGHSYGLQEQSLASFDPNEWPDCAPYLYGVDLFNQGYWWEAHEAWESVWRAAGRHTAAGLFVQGLIQIAVAQLKLHQGFDDAARRLAVDGLGKISRMRGTYLGIDVQQFRSDAESRFSCGRAKNLFITLGAQRTGAG